MSSDQGSKRLASLSGSNASGSGLKFKPKAVARRSKEERDASAPALKVEKDEKSGSTKKKSDYNRKGNNDGKDKRLPKYLTNTKVISSGPLAAGNFIGGDKSEKRGFVKIENSNSVNKTLKSLSKEEDDDDDEEHDDEDKIGRIDGDSAKDSLMKFNMGKEFVLQNADLADSDDNEDGEFIAKTDDNLIKNLFPVRAVRIKHEDFEAFEQKSLDQKSASVTPLPTTLAPTEVDNLGSETELQTSLKQRQLMLKDKIAKLSLQQSSDSLLSPEAMRESIMILEDYNHINKQLQKLSNKSNSFMMFQLPLRLPEFEDHSDISKEEDNEQENKSKATEKQQKNDSKTNVVFAHQTLPTGRIGSLRIHKSGKLSVKIADVEMEIGKGTSSTFLQDLVALHGAQDDDIDEESNDEVYLQTLGSVGSRVVVRPKV